MSMIHCNDCGKWIDTDFHPVYYHLSDDILCEECFLKLPEDKQKEYTE